MRNYVLSFGGILIAMIAYLSFLDYRDQKLFEAYSQQTPKERYCKQQAHWHPDCNVE